MSDPILSKLQDLLSSGIEGKVASVVSMIAKHKAKMLAASNKEEQDSEDSNFENQMSQFEKEIIDEFKNLFSDDSEEEKELEEKPLKKPSPVVLKKNAQDSVKGKTYKFCPHCGESLA